MLGTFLNLLRRRPRGPAEFVVRSGTRDRLSDTRRIESVRRSVAAAISDAAREYDGLVARRERARHAMAASLGDTDGIYEQREPEIEEDLRQAEVQFKAAEERSLVLKRHLAVLNRIVSMLDERDSAR